MVKSKIEKPNLSERNARISEWEKKFSFAKTQYQTTLDEMNDNYKAYKGTREIYNSKGELSNKKKTSVRKVAFELVESQVDTNIPQPKITSVNGYIDRAQIIEYYLKNELDRLPFEEINDEQARNTPVKGGSVFFVEWDNSIITRNTIGKLRVKNIDPSEIIPQPGVYSLDEMDYVFMELLQTKQEVKLKYGVDVSEEGNSEPDKDPTHNDELVTHYFVYYRNKQGYISLFSWINDKVIQDVDNYFARKVEVCTKCGSPKDIDGNCSNPDCNNKKFELKTLKEEKINIPVMATNLNTGQQEITQQEIKIDYYIPKKYPFVILKNTSEYESFIGNADITAIKDQQNDLNICTTKIREKLLKGGSIVTIPHDIKFKATNDELKIITLKNPAQKAMIDVKSMQPNVSNDLLFLDKTYDIARQTIGITDSFQGRRDNTALSGKAKEFSAQQTAGRLESKKAMKNFAYSQLFEVMFQFMLAFADEPRKYHYEDDEGNLKYRVFDKRSFISDNGEKGDKKKYFYDDEFIFACDPSAILSTNRRAMWEETRLNFTSGAYGDPTDLQTIHMFWQTMDALHYPGAKQALKFSAQRVSEQQHQQQMQQQQLATAEGNKMAVDALGKINASNKQTNNK